MQTVQFSPRYHSNFLSQYKYLKHLFLQCDSIGKCAVTKQILGLGTIPLHPSNILGDSVVVFSINSAFFCQDLPSAEFPIPSVPGFYAFSVTLSESMWSFSSCHLSWREHFLMKQLMRWNLWTVKSDTCMCICVSDSVYLLSFSYFMCRWDHNFMHHSR